MKIYSSDSILLLDTVIDGIETASGYSMDEIMTDDKFHLNFSFNRYVEIPQGAWCEFYNRKYFLLEDVEPTKINTENFEYKLVFDTYIAYLKTQIFEFVSLDKFGNGAVAEYLDPVPEFSLTGTPIRFVELLVDNMNLKDKERGWKVGECIQADEITIDFNRVFCYNVLGILTDRFKTEWEVDNKTVHLRKVEKMKDSAIPLSYGYGKGLLPGITRSVYNKPTGRLVISTSERNIDQAKYKSRTLKMPKNKTIIYEGVEYQTDNTGTKIQRKNPLFGGNIIPEETFDLTHIYPKRVGTVSKVTVIDDSKGLYDISDNSIPESLDFKKMIIPGETMAIVFQTGQLAGRGGENGFATGYVHADRKFTIKPIDDNGLTYPQGTIIPAVGDKYAVFHINLPQDYITDAENEALDQSVRRLYVREKYEYTYKATLDEKYVKQNWGAIGGFLHVGYFVKLAVPEFFQDEQDIRIISVKRYIDKPRQPEISLANNVSGKSYTNQQNKLNNQEQTIDRTKKETIDYARRSWRDSKELIEAVKGMVDDFENSRLSAEVFEGMMALFGSESLQFQFLADNWTTAISPFISYDPATKQIKCGASKIQHMTMGIDSVQPERDISKYKFWTAPEYISAVLTDSDQPYFVYMQASKTFKNIGGRNVGEATFFISKDKIKLEDTPGYYTLWVGYLNSENMEGGRSYRSMYGFTEILPGQITVDKLLSTSGALVIDLLNGVISARNGAIIQGNIKFLSNGNYQDVGEAIDQTNEKIDNIQIGSRNYLPGSRFDTVSGWNTSQGNASIYNDTNFGNVVRYERLTGAGNYQKSFTVADKASLTNTDLVYYVIARRSSGTFYFGGYPDTFTKLNSDTANKIDLGNGWVQYWTTFKSGDTLGAAFGLNSITGAWLFYAAGVLKGNKPNDWTPAQEDVQKEIDEAKQDADNAQSTANTANQNLSNLNTYVDGAFKDGVINNAEAKAIEKYLNTLDESMSQVEATYNKLYVNGYLEGVAKTALLNTKVSLFGARDNLKASINKAIAGGETTPAQKADVDTKFTAFNSALKSFQNAVEDANKSIQTKLDSISAGYAALAKSAADAAQLTANNAKITADTATGRLNNWASDSIISPTEKAALKQQSADIRSEYQEIASQAVKYSLTTSSEWTNFYSAYNLAIAALGKYTATSPENIPVNADYANIAGYYPKRQSILDKIATAAKQYAETLVDNIQIGGRNYTRNFKSWNQPINATVKLINDNYILLGLVNQSSNGAITSHMITRQGEYIVAVNVKTTLASRIYIDPLATVIKTSHDQYRDGLYFNLPANFNERIIVYAKASQLVTNYWYFGIDGKSVAKSVEFSYPQLITGNKNQDWTPAVEDVQKGIDDAKAQVEALEYIKTALENRTEIDGGLLLTALLKLGTFSGKTFNEKAGINGTAKNANDVVAWFGGTLQQAIQNLAAIVFRMDGTAMFGKGTTLFNADGSGKVANGNISWDKLGNTLVKGKFESSNEATRIVIDPVTKEFQFYLNNKLTGRIFIQTQSDTGVSSACFESVHANEGGNTYKVRLTSAGLEVEANGIKVLSLGASSVKGRFGMVGLLPSANSVFDINGWYVDDNGYVRIKK